MIPKKIAERQDSSAKKLSIKVFLPFAGAAFLVLAAVLALPACKRIIVTALASTPEGNEKLNPMVTHTAFFDEFALYKVSMHGIPIGSAAAVRIGGKKNAERLVKMKILHRLGPSRVISEYTFSQKSPSEDWKESLVVKSNTTDTLLEPQAIKQLLLSFPQAKTQLFINSNTPQEKLKSLSLFFKENDLNQLNTQAPQYDKDGFFKNANLDVGEFIGLEFTKILAEEAKQVAAAITKQPIELSGFSSEQSMATDLAKLRNQVESCTTFAQDAENQVRREFPQLPYLVHRRIFNLGKLCSRLAMRLADPEMRLKPMQSLDEIHWIFREMVDEDKLELPVDMLGHPNLPVLLDPSLRWQWIRITAGIIDAAQTELATVIAIERTQKVNLTVKVLVNKLSKGSVVKGTLKAKDVRFKVDVRLAANDKMSPSSWTFMPDNSKGKVRLAASNHAAFSVANASASTNRFELFSGLTVASEQNLSIGSICDKFDGNVGLDLGDTKETLVSNGKSWGIWDQQMRLETMRTFARKAGSHASCRNLIVVVPRALESAARKEALSFQRNVLQLESDFQIVNTTPKRIRVLPGVYELTITSFVTGETLGKRNILIPEGTNNMAVSVKFPN